MRSIIRIMAAFAIILSMTVIGQVRGGMAERESALSNIDDLRAFLLDLTSELTAKEACQIASSYGLYNDHRNMGNGREQYRFALEKGVASTIKKENGSVIILEYSLWNKKELSSIYYFDEERMIEAFWMESNGFEMIDLNNPQEYSVRKSVGSFEDVVAYYPSIQSKNNLLEELFLVASDKMTKNEVLSYVKRNGLYYDSRGKGNYKLIAYNSNVTEKYGDNGSYLIVDFGKDEKLTKIEYHYYPVEYRTGSYIGYYAEDYPYMDDYGYFFAKTYKEVSKVGNAQEAIAQLHALIE